MKCPHCGAENLDGATFCGICGNPLSSPPPAEKGLGLMKTMLIVIVVLVVVMVALVVASGVLTYKHGTVDLRIDSAHPLTTIHVTVYVDGVQKESFDLPPGFYFENNYTVSFPNDSKLITVEATSTGGSTGATSDSKQVTVLKDQTVKVTLLV